MKYAFRCKSCGRLENADHAAECHAPHACRVCGSGVKFCVRTGVKTPCPENWEALADATDARLAELGLTRDQVEQHKPWPKGHTPERQPAHLKAHAADGTTSLDTAGG